MFPFGTIMAIVCFPLELFMAIVCFPLELLWLNKVMGSLGKKQNHPVDLDLVFSCYPFPCHINCPKWTLQLVTVLFIYLFIYFIYLFILKEIF